MKSLLSLAIAVVCLVLPAVPAIAQTFPLTIEHKFGTTVIPEKPERVASVDYGGIGNLLALGVQPLTVLQWRAMDGFEFTAGPWAEPLLTTEPIVLEGELDFEAIAGTAPDVIIALYSGIDEAEYERLSLIAPVVPVPQGVGDYALSWQDRALLAAQALGKQAEAERQIAAIEDKLSGIRDDHIEWQDMSAVVAYVSEGTPTAYTPYDVRAQFVSALGFESPQALSELADPQTFYLDLSAEQIEPIDADIVVWYSGSDSVSEIMDYPGRQFLKAYENGGEIFLPDNVIAAFARVSLLSIPVFIDALVPMLEAAADGDPETIVPDARQ